MSYQLDLSDFKKSRPHLEHFLSWLELILLRHDSSPPTNALLPHPEEVIRDYKIYLPILSLDPHSEDFKRCLKTCIDFFDGHHKTYDPQSFGMILSNGFPKLYETLKPLERDGFEVSDFLGSSMMVALHHALKGQTIEYHQDLSKLLLYTRIDKSCDIPVTQIKLPYPSLYFNWKELGVYDELGNKHLGVYVQESQMPYHMIRESGLLESDPSLKRSVEAGTILPDFPLKSISLLFVTETESGEPALTLFVIAYSEMPDLTLEKAIRAHQDARSEHDEDEFSFTALKRPIGMAVNSLLYMISDDSYREEIKQGTDLELQIKRLKNPAKKRKLENKYRREVYNYVRIGKQYTLPDFSASSEKGAKGTHIRWGHFHRYFIGPRFKYDENGDKAVIPTNQRESVVHWLKPTIVNPDKGDVNIKNRKLQ